MERIWLLRLSFQEREYMNDLGLNAPHDLVRGGALRRVMLKAVHREGEDCRLDNRQGIKVAILVGKTRSHERYMIISPLSSSSYELIHEGYSESVKLTLSKYLSTLSVYHVDSLGVSAREKHFEQSSLDSPTSQPHGRSRSAAQRQLRQLHQLYYAPVQACFVGWTQTNALKCRPTRGVGQMLFPNVARPLLNRPLRAMPPNPRLQAMPLGRKPPHRLTQQRSWQIFPNALPIYKYENFVAMAAKYPAFANMGDADFDRRKVAAFRGQISLESGDLQYVEEINKSDYNCQASADYPCAAGKQYYGRGPIQLSWNYNYKDFGMAFGFDLVSSPELIATNADLVWYSLVVLERPQVERQYPRCCGQAWWICQDHLHHQRWLGVWCEPAEP
ncbi:Aste57867_16053 [Aphanomyces stellatus]|uniref:Aste57867_16053 protein n=1 Tax=Aphanomyces stellatus TaxID=120398 RepID=A0A485L4V5_9STRA|nr:hypothetical protein As57867_015997 [Aphanomyces stellatus]VFT92837.1 Aste57867_16053 [Aphanomyces stellatus]